MFKVRLIQKGVHRSFKADSRVEGWAHALSTLAVFQPWPSALDNCIRELMAADGVSISHATAQCFLEVFLEVTLQNQTQLNLEKQTLA